MVEAHRRSELSVPLGGSLATLEPLDPAHADGLWRAAQAPEIWRWLAHIGSSREYFDNWFELSLAAHREGREGVFAIRRQRDGEIAGSSRYMAVRPADRALEIGWTWFNPSVWRSGLNVEVKLLMLAHAFDDLECVRVEFKTDARNERSRAAIAALPAQYEGVLRNHMIVPDVGLRDSAYYSVIEAEWPAVARQPRTPPHFSSRPPGCVTRSARCRTSSTASRVAATASSRAAATPSLGLPPTMSRKAFLKRSVRRSDGNRASALTCFFGLRSPYRRRAQAESGLPIRQAP